MNTKIRKRCELVSVKKNSFITLQHFIREELSHYYYIYSLETDTILVIFINKICQYNNVLRNR